MNTAPLACEITKWNPYYHRDSCEDCKEGFYCEGESTTQENILFCDSGMYCVAGRKTPELCPKGTFNPTKNAVALTDCIPCPVGHYCAVDGLSAPSGECAAGYYCEIGAELINPAAVIDIVAGTP